MIDLRIAPASRGILRFLGIGPRLNASQKVTLDELMNLSDRQLEDIGLTRGLIETVVIQGPEGVRALNPQGAVQAANNDRLSAVVA
ncbi:MAG: DUF1127 domain-containing protein [Inquilinaceae bacterium]